MEDVLYEAHYRCYSVFVRKPKLMLMYKLAWQKYMCSKVGSVQVITYFTISNVLAFYL